MSELDDDDHTADAGDELLVWILVGVMAITFGVALIGGSVSAAICFAALCYSVTHSDWR